MKHYKSNGLCRYEISSDGWIGYDTKIAFIDSVGKYQLDQHLYVTFETAK